MDIAVANYESNTVSAFLNTTVPGATTPSFSTKSDFATGERPISVFIGDLNGDGRPDIAVANYKSNTVSVFLNTTAPGATVPSFSAKTDFTTGDAPVSIFIGDLNGDGKPDIAAVNYRSNTVSVFLNTTAPGAMLPSFSTKTDFTTAERPVSVSLGDLNGDGKLDIAVANYGFNTVSVFLNTMAPGASTPLFSSKTDFPTGTNPQSVCFGEFSRDGKQDIAVADYNSSMVSVFLNTTAFGATVPSFSTRTDLTAEIGPSSISIGDFNGDGRPDVSVVNYGSNTFSVFLNMTAPGDLPPKR